MSLHGYELSAVLYLESNTVETHNLGIKAPSPPFQKTCYEA
jgi:hypothetical protein